MPKNILAAIIRRFDLDGDARLSPAEFEEMLKPVIKFNKRGAKTDGLEPYFKKPVLKHTQTGRLLKVDKEITDIKKL